MRSRISGTPSSSIRGRPSIQGALRAEPLDVAEFYQIKVYFSWTEFEVSDFGLSKSLLFTFPSHAAQRRSSEKSAFENGGITPIFSVESVSLLGGGAWYVTKIGRPFTFCGKNPCLARHAAQGELSSPRCGIFSLTAVPFFKKIPVPKAFGRKEQGFLPRNREFEGRKFFCRVLWRRGWSLGGTSAHQPG
jgi:hypothetical protein